MARNLLPCLSLALPALACNLNGTWVDVRAGDIATMLQDADGALLATSLSQSGWTNATGAVSGPDSVWMVFNTANLTGQIFAECSGINWSNGATWQSTQPNTNITTVHVVFMTHLDVGFTLLANDVCEEYFQKHFPNGIALSKELQAAGGPAQYAVTSHPWLIQEYLDGAAQCGRTPRTPAQIALMEDAIAQGFVRWHGKPMNNFVELEDGPWFDTSLGMAGTLNAAFNKSWGTVTCKSTDVPGMSRSSIPHFAAAGKLALHIGYNSACRVPDIPMAFNWVHEETGTQLLTFVNNNYGSIITVPGSPDALAFLYSPDNSGPPPNAAAVTSWWASTQAAFPAATLTLSSLDAFAEAILPMRSSLPVITSEIGQSWSYGAPADPLKMAAFRAIRRTRNAAVEAGALAATDPDLLAYERRLWVGGPEHNWGLCFGCFLPQARSPQGNWSNAQFHTLRYRPDYAFIESGNIEKRNFTLPLPPPSNASAGYLQFLDDAANAVAALVPTAPDLSSYTKVAPGVPLALSCGRFSSATFSPNDGSLTSLVHAETGFDFAAGGTLGAFSYKTYTEWNFDVWNREYNPGCGPPCGDFAKWGMDTASPVNQTWLPSLVGLYQQQQGSGSGCSFIAQLALDPATVTLYGGSAAIFLNVTIDPTPLAASPTLLVDIRWLNKTATRLAESTWLAFVPALGDDTNATAREWTMDVLGYPVSPLDVVPMGTKHIHAVWDGVLLDVPASTTAPFIRIRSLDAPLVAPGDSDHLLWYDGYADPDMTGGWHFNLHNNVWGTAFPQWYGDDGLFRFEMTMQPPRSFGRA